MAESVNEALEALREVVESRSGDRGLPLDPTQSSADARGLELFEHVDANLVGRRVLAVGPRASHDALPFVARHADYVLACEPPDQLLSPEMAESEHGSPVEIMQLEWDALDPDRYGTFDIVHCSGLLHRVLEPITLLRTLRRVTAPGGSLLIESMMLGDPERSEYLRFVPAEHAGDPTWWFLPGRLAFRWLVETAGFRVEAAFGELEGPRDGFPVVSGYLRAVPEPT